MYGIVGNNGSGKTVLMKCICGFLIPTTGLIQVFGSSIGQDVDFPESLGVIIETPGFLTNLTGRKNLEILAGMRRKIGPAEIQQVLEKVGLDPALKKPVANYSLGMRQRLGIAAAIMGKPDIILLDEPINAIDAEGVSVIRDAIRALMDDERIIIIACHDKEEMEYMADTVLHMSEGRLEEEA